MMNVNDGQPVRPSPLESLPRTLATSILPYVTSDDWMNFRAASRGCHDIVHGTSDVCATFCPTCQEGRNARRDGASEEPASGEAESESESLWRLALARDYGFGKPHQAADIIRGCIHSPVEPSSDAFLSTGDAFVAPNSYVAWKHWRRIDQRLHRQTRPRGKKTIPDSEKVVGPYFLRACSMWENIEQWCKDEGRSGPLGSEILASLSHGRPMDPNADGRIENARTSALKAVYAFYAGQRDPMMEAPTEAPERFNPFTGLFGGFSAYNIISCTRFVEPEWIVEEDRDDDRHLLNIAECPALKTIALDLRTGKLQLTGTSEGQNLTFSAAGPRNDPHGPDQILRWFEEHADRLHRNFYAVGNIVANSPVQRVPLSLLRYPTLADTANCSRAVTRGVEVVASSVFVPEMFMFVYSIRMRLLAPDDGDGYESPQQRGFETCQLVSRHWMISKVHSDRREPEIDEVRGEGVIGFYPLLREGGYVNYSESGGRYQLCGSGQGHFSYQSCSEARMPGSIEGSLQFQPGSLDTPDGDIFDVRVAQFPLTMTNFLY